MAGFVPPPHSTAGCPGEARSLAEQLSVAEADPKAADSQSSLAEHTAHEEQMSFSKGDTA